MNCDELQQLTALEAIGALDGASADAAILRDRLREDAAARAELARFLDVSGILACTLNVERPSPGVRGRVLERIRNHPQARRGPGSAPPAGAVNAPPSPPISQPVTEPTPGLESPVPSGFRFIGPDAPWLPAPIPGGRLKVLSSGPNQDYLMLLIDLAPGTVYPDHDHAGVEEMYVLTGDLQTEGRSLGPGDFLHAEPGSHHQALRTIHGCTAIMIVPAAALASLGG